MALVFGKSALDTGAASAHSQDASPAPLPGAVVVSLPAVVLTVLLALSAAWAFDRSRRARHSRWWTPRLGAGLVQIALAFRPADRHNLTIP